MMAEVAADHKQEIGFVGNGVNVNSSSDTELRLSR